MTTIAIEIADVGLQATGDSGPIGPSSPGYALLDRGNILVGEPARAASRLKPRFISHRYWDRLNRESVGRPFPRGVTHADLVYAHLSDFWAGLRQSLEISLPRTSVLLAVPASYSADQLSLLLGIARACDMPVTGLVDASLAALDGVSGEGATLHLDLHLHRAVWAVFGGGDRLVRMNVESVESAGLLSFQEAWVRLIADRFVRETRFDPLHGAASEQALYDRLPDWTERIDVDGRATLTLDAKREQRAVEIGSDQLIAAAEAPLDAILEAAHQLLERHGQASLALSSEAGRIAGLPARLAELSGSEPRRLPAGAATRGALAHRSVVEAPGREVPLVLGLPAQERHG